jgi:transcriptional regulator with PAS, ATPase and Fis domain
MDMSQITQMFEQLNMAILASDANFKVIYQNEKCKQLFEKEFGKADYLGSDIAECHPAEATKKVKNYFKEYENKTRHLDYYVIDEPAGKVTVVNVPFYDGETFKGVVEFVFESSLA